MSDSLYSKMFKTRDEVIRGAFAEYIYRHESNGESPGSFIAHVRERERLTDDEVERLRTLMELYLKNEGSLYERLERTLVGWRPDRLLALDRAAILAGMTELLFTDGEPERIIYDYGTFAKRFSAEKSPSFVMGVLKSFKRGLEDGKT
ncbi:MAG: hypothetical protein GXO29_01455 [Thermotogae bacterium]|nr:hypothetical protein [Thermotogota bacterium]